MRIGIDLDNTTICYDPLFYKICHERDLILEPTPVSKGAIRDHLRAQGLEETWIELQGEVYGHRIREALPFEGVQAFIHTALSQNHSVFIVSHKTRHPFRGPQYDLHQAALDWLDYHQFFTDKVGLPREHVFLELTKEAKITRIAQLECSHFIDDLPEFLSMESFPPIQRLLFDPNQLHPEHVSYTRRHSWQALSQTLLDLHQTTA